MDSLLWREELAGAEVKVPIWVVGLGQAESEAGVQCHEQNDTFLESEAPSA
jgi:hypothetical protein